MDLFPGSPSPRDRRRLILIALLRPTLTTLVLLTVYFVVPLDRVGSISAVLMLVGGFGVVVLAGIWQVRKILAAEYPALQAVEALTVVLSVYLVMFAVVYFLMSVVGPENFDEPLSRIDALYFCLTVFSTVGFGDITAVGDTARAVVSVQMIGNLIFLALGIRLLTAVVQWRRRHRDDGAG